MGPSQSSINILAYLNDRFQQQNDHMMFLIYLSFPKYSVLEDRIECRIVEMLSRSLFPRRNVHRANLVGDLSCMAIFCSNLVSKVAQSSNWKNLVVRITAITTFLNSHECMGYKSHFLTEYDEKNQNYKNLV